MTDKSQIIRIADVLIIGPLMIYAGVIQPPPKDWLKYALIGIGVATIVYNGQNWLARRKELGNV